MARIEALSDPLQLRRCIGDLVALSTLSASWKNYDPIRAVAKSVNAARRLIERDEKLANSNVSEVMSEAIEQTLRAGRIVQRLHDFLARGEAEKRKSPHDRGC